MPNVTVTLSVATGADTKTGKIVASGNGGIIDDIALSASQTNLHVILGFKITDLVASALVFVADQACVIKTNSSSAPDDTIHVPAGGFVNVGSLAADITSIYVTNSSASAATLSIRGCCNVTP